MSQIFELRQYTLHPGQRDVLIELFDREFVESQEDLGIEVVGQFRDLDRPDRFVWVRGFASMEARKTALSAFYGGPVWAAHQDVANPTMIDFDDVRLLRPASAGGGFPPMSRTDAGARAADTALTTATIYSFAEPVTEAVLELFDRVVEPLLTRSGSDRSALLRTEPSPNTYRALPVREGEHVVVRFGRQADEHTHAAADSARQAATASLTPYLLSAPIELRLEPTLRSLLR
ncbi:NIPSNAP family protein [Cryptosporangium sp. NPDC051539]|uniref:NIPSNAP family protein n=1 Tax=Cryptosporangium sp. NPDC051539 TaxID=3363962 RepID=UPI0037BA9E42